MSSVGTVSKTDESESIYYPRIFQSPERLLKVFVLPGEAAYQKCPKRQHIVSVMPREAAHSICLLFLELDINRRDRLEDG